MQSITFARGCTIWLASDTKRPGLYDLLVTSPDSHLAVEKHLSSVFNLAKWSQGFEIECKSINAVVESSNDGILDC